MGKANDEAVMGTQEGNDEASAKLPVGRSGGEQNS